MAVGRAEPGGLGRRDAIKLLIVAAPHLVIAHHDAIGTASSCTGIRRIIASLGRRRGIEAIGPGDVPPGLLDRQSVLGLELPAERCSARPPSEPLIRRSFLARPRGPGHPRATAHSTDARLPCLVRSQIDYRTNADTYSLIVNGQPGLLRGEERLFAHSHPSLPARTVRVAGNVSAETDRRHTALRRVLPWRGG